MPISEKLERKNEQRKNKRKKLIHQIIKEKMSGKNQLKLNLLLANEPGFLGVYNINKMKKFIVKKDKFFVLFYCKKRYILLYHMDHAFELVDFKGNL